MLFNSYAFVVFFLPLTLVAYVVLQRLGRTQAALWVLLGASLFFYGWWSPRYLLLLVGSVLLNHAMGGLLRRARRGRRGLLALGVGANLAAIGWFKYAGFLAENAAWLTGAHLTIPEVALPLAISFFTFQQITYLVDVYRGTSPQYDLLRYALFVTFFPQLIAGPIVRHDETIPQLGRRRSHGAWHEDVAVGVSIFCIGLFKKVILADSLALHATPVFDWAQAGGQPGLLAAWGGALAYTFQLYFDFSGYTDMAIGSARLFGVRLPANFDSPYKATSIIDFWRRWHVTLSRFLRDDLYIPLGGNRKGRVRRYVNLMITMLLGGLWHGAAWTFVLWGGLHGALLVVNHGLRALWSARAPPAGGAGPGARLGTAVAWLATFVSVVLAWVLFRSADLPTAAAFYRGMAGLAGAGSPGGVGVSELGWVWIAGAFAIARGLPNTQEWMAEHRPVLGAVEPPTRPLMGWLPAWSPSPGWALAVGLLGAFAFAHLDRVTEFLYFRF